jgi:5'-AMP-activated protein kinase catalytic alpha subunit
VQVKDLIRRVLETNPRKRYTMEDVRRHPWYRQVASPPPAVSYLPTSLAEISPLVLRRIKEFGLDPKLVADAVLRNAHNHATTTYYLREWLRGLACGDVRGAAVSWC